MNHPFRPWVCDAPTNEASWLDAELLAWGPAVDDGRRLRTLRSVEIVASRLGLSIDVVADKLNASRRCDRYLLLDRLGQSRHSTVFAAVDRLLARPVALKIHHDDRDDDGARRVLVEARAMSRLEHVNVVRLHEVGEHGGWMYSVTELCDSDMTAWCVGKPWAEVISRIIEAGRGLAELHSAGLVHGDIKPANILIKSGVAKVADFGMSTEPGWTHRIMGTPGYIAPEVADGCRAPAGDVFSLACSAWYCLFGESPFGDPPEQADVSAATMVLVERARAEESRSPTAPDVPGAVVETLRASLSPDPLRRLELEGLLAGLSALRVRGSRRAPWSRVRSWLTTL